MTRWSGCPSSTSPIRWSEAILRPRAGGGRLAPRVLDARRASAAIPVFDRLDALVDYTSPVWKDTLKFIEPNLTGIGGLHLVPSVEEVVSETIVPLHPGAGRGTPDRRGSPTRASCSSASSSTHLAAIGRPGGRVCFVEPKYELEGIDEQRRLMEYFRDRHGMETLHADPSELRMKGGEVYYEDARVDLVYRDYSVLDLVEIERDGVDVTPMRTLVPREPGDQLDRRRAGPQGSWEILTDPELAGRHFDEASRHCFQRHVLWTRVLSDRRTTPARRRYGRPARVSPATPVRRWC